MYDLFWTLPGPSRFMAKVRTDLDKGISAVIRLPSMGVPCFEQRIRESLDGIEMRHDTMYATEGIEPMLQLAGKYGVSGKSMTLRDKFMTISRSGRRVIIVQGVPAKDWKRWKDTLVTFNDIARQLPQSERASLAVLLVGKNFQDTRCVDVALQNHDWVGVFGKSDSLCLAEHLLPINEGREEIRQLLVHTLASVAMWDCELLKVIANKSPNSILDPHKTLAEYAEMQGWSSGTPIEEWSGTSARYEGHQTTHLALAFTIGDMQAVELALWRAQVGLILPGVELSRLHLVEELIKRGVATSATRDEEIGTLFAKYYDNNRIGGGLRKRLFELREIRNKLAHKECLPADQVFKAPFY